MIQIPSQFRQLASGNTEDPQRIEDQNQCDSYSGVTNTEHREKITSFRSDTIKAAVAFDKSHIL